jgi:uncharacterized lipoprotein
MRLFFVSAGLLLLVSGCGAIKSDLEKCHKPQEYQTASIGPRVRVPGDLEPLNPDARLDVPFGATQTKPTEKGQPCMVDPPEYTDRKVD